MHQTFHSTPTWTLHGRPQTITISNQPISYPGPSDYKYDKITPKNPAFVIGTAKRQVFNASDANPGPGAYELKSGITEGPKKSMAGRLEDLVLKKKSPGPQDYEPKQVKMAGPKYTIRMRSRSFQDIMRDKNRDNPAPGQYPLAGSFNNPKGVIGTSVRKQLDPAQKTPGPGTYLTIERLDKSKLFNSTTNPRCTIGTSPRKPNFLEASANLPGPGTYSSQEFANLNKQKKKGYTMRPQTTDLDALNKTKVPGPGQYNTTLGHKFRSPSYSYGGNKRLSFGDSQKNTPGPGTHEAKPDFRYRTTTSWKFSTSPRKSLYQNEKTPGPGTYEERKNNVMTAAPKFSVSKSLAAIEEYMGSKKSTPGPTQYDPKYKLVKEALPDTFIPHEKRPDFEKAKFTPGPGQYMLSGKHGGPGWTFGSEKKLSFTESAEASRSPGPPDYKIKAMVPNPPSYMRVSDKLQFKPNTTS